MNLERAQQALCALFQSGAFYYPENLATVPYDVYREIIESTQPPEQYSIGYDLMGVNWLENCYLDSNEYGIVEMIRRERTWETGQVRAFQLEIIKVPRMVLVTTEPEEESILSTTWYLHNDGGVIAYLQTMNGHVLEDIRSE